MSEKSNEDTDKENMEYTNDKLTAHSLLVLLIAAFKFSNVSRWNSISPHEKSNLATNIYKKKSTKAIY